MQAVRFGRYHTSRPRVVCFAGGYHGWWGDVQPGVGNPLPLRDTYMLREMHACTLDALKARRDVACVLVNPVQALHSNRAAPTDAALFGAARLASTGRPTPAGLTSCGRCARKGVSSSSTTTYFLDFRIVRGATQEYFGLEADLVMYGKAVVGGLPVGVVCRRERFMRRFRDVRPAA